MNERINSSGVVGSLTGFVLCWDPTREFADRYAVRSDEKV